MTEQKILVIDDDPQLLKIVQLNLEAASYQIISAKNGEEGMRLFYAQQPDMLILDVAMPKLSGFQVCERVREISTVPILMLTAHNRKADIIKGLDLGADDYLAKPFDVGELLARVRAALRRGETAPTQEQTPSGYQDDYLQIDLQAHRISIKDKLIKLSPTEYKLLSYLVENCGQLLEFKQILENVWGFEYVDDIDYLRVYIWHLRRKLEPNPKAPIYLLNELNMGYRFEPQN